MVRLLHFLNDLKNRCIKMFDNLAHVKKIYKSRKYLMFFELMDKGYKPKVFD